jgi:hypothetical protein
MIKPQLSHSWYVVRPIWALQVKMRTINNCELKNKEKGPENIKLIIVKVPIKWGIEIDTMKPPQFLTITGKVNKQQS